MASLAERGLADVHVRVVEAGHDERAVEIDDARFRAEPGLDVGSVDWKLFAGPRFGVGNRDDRFAANRDGAGPFVGGVHRFNLRVREDEIGRDLAREKASRLMSCSRVWRGRWTVRGRFRNSKHAQRSTTDTVAREDRQEKPAGHSRAGLRRARRLRGNRRFRPSSRPVASYHSASGVRAAAFSSAAERNGGNAERERNVGVGGTAFEARAIAEKAVHAAESFEQRRIIWQAFRRGANRASGIPLAANHSRRARRPFLRSRRLAWRRARRAPFCSVAASSSERRSTFTAARDGMEFTEVPPSMTAKIVGAARIVGKAERKISRCRGKAR